MYDEIIKNMFKEKEEFHKENCKESIEIKVKKLVELQKIALTINPDLNKNSLYPKRVWKI